MAIADEHSGNFWSLDGVRQHKEFGWSTPSAMDLLVFVGVRNFHTGRFSSAKQREFETTAQGCRLATSVGGVLTGRGADFIIIDDPLKPEEALSQAQRQAANEWYDHTLYSRLNDKLSGAIVLIMHRLHEDDLAGHVLAQEDWEVVHLPAVAEEDELHRVETYSAGNPLAAKRARRGRARAARIARPAPPDHRRIQFRRPVPAGADAIGRRHDQIRVVQELRDE